MTYTEPIVQQNKVLIVDDEDLNRKLMTSMLENKGFLCETAVNGLEAIEKARKYPPDIILLDIMMPEMDGYAACRKLREDPQTAHIPIIIVTALADREAKMMGLECGANDFLSKPLDPAEIMVRTSNLLKIKKFEDMLLRHNETLEAEVSKRTAELRNALSELAQTNEALVESKKKLVKSHIDTIHRLTIVAEFKDEDTAAHIKRISHYCGLMARALSMPHDTVELITYASPMHDIGKVGIPSDIILKPARLTLEEFALMKTHTTIGARILDGSDSPMLEMAGRIALCHHERWDGGGYPRGIKGDEIPLEARIMNIADQYDALRSRRPYKPPFDHDKAFKIITEGDGRTLPSHFDPKVLDVFRAEHLKFKEIFDTNQG